MNSIIYRFLATNNVPANVGLSIGSLRAYDNYREGRKNFTDIISPPIIGLVVGQYIGNFVEISNSGKMITMQIIAIGLFCIGDRISEIYFKNKSVFD